MGAQKGTRRNKRILTKRWRKREKKKKEAGAQGYRTHVKHRSCHITMQKETQIVDMTPPESIACVRGQLHCFPSKEENERRKRMYSFARTAMNSSFKNTIRCMVA